MAVGYDGGTGVSVAEQELFEYSAIPRKFYRFSFMNYDKRCTIKVNGSNPIPCPPNVGFAIDTEDAPIKSFVIVEEGISYDWSGRY